MSEPNLNEIQCTLCQKPIANYDPEFHSLPLDGNNRVNICPACVDRFLKWQQRKYARLFPTRTMKKHFANKET